MILVGMEFLRLIIMVIAELIRMRYYSFVKSVKNNVQIMIFISRFIFNIVLLVPFFWIGYVKALLSGMGFWLPLSVLSIEEIPSVFLMFYLAFFKGRSLTKYFRNL